MIDKLGAVSLVYGMEVMINDRMVSVPARQLERKKWMRRGVYFDRINKKWRKRFGTKLEPFIADGRVISGMGVLFMNSRTLDKLRKQIDQATAEKRKERCRDSRGRVVWR